MLGAKSEPFSCNDLSKEYHRPHESHSCSCLRPWRGIDDRSRDGPDTCSPGTDTCSSQPAAAAAPVTPQAIPAKIALVAFEQAVFATNEGQKAVQDIQKKYKPKKDQIDSLSHEVDSLKKQLQSAPATLSDAERARELKRSTPKRSAEPRRRGCADCLQRRSAGGLWQGCGEGLGDAEEVRQRQRLYAAARCQQPAEQRDVGESRALT